MKKATTIALAVAFAAAVLVALPALSSGALAQTGHEMHQKPLPEQAKAPVFNDLPGYGKKCWIGEEYYFTYKFDKKPKLGTAILKVQLFDAKGARVTAIEITGASDMPSMRGAHDSGEVPFKLNKKGDYLLPVNIVMPGEWEVKITFLKDKAPIYRGAFRFEI